MAKIVFKYSKSTTRSGGAVMQMHGQKHVVEVEGEGMTYPSLARAEREFVDWFYSENAYSELLEWTAHYEDEIHRYSTYRAFIAVGTGQK